MRLAVLDLEAKGVSKVIASSVSDLLRTEMVDTGQFIIVERSQMDNILKEHELQQTGCTDNSCAVQLGKILSAKKILIGEVNQIDSEVIITTRVVDVEKGIADFASSEKARNLNDFDRATKSLAAKLTERITGKRVVSLQTGFSDDIKNNIVYRASRIRFGLIMPGPINSVSDSLGPSIGPFSGILLDIFLYRLRNQDGDGLDFFIRGVANVYELKGFSDLGLDLESVSTNYHLRDNEMWHLGGGAGARYIQGYYLADVLWQGYVLAYYQYSKAESDIEYSPVSGPEGISALESKKKYTSHGLIGGVGIEIGLSSYFGIFCEYTYGFSKISFPAKDKNLEEGTIRFGATIRSYCL